MPSVEFKDLDIAKDLNKYLKNLGGNIEGVEFVANKRREDGSLTNKNILVFLKDGGRDFVTMTKQDTIKVQRAFTTTVANKMRTLKTKDVKRFSSQLNKIVVEALKQSLLTMIGIIEKRLKAGKDYKGSSLRTSKDLSDQYKKQKQDKYGHIYPVGIASGQLVDNVKPDEKNIKIIKK